MRVHEIPGHIQTIYLIEYPEKLLLLDGCCRVDVIGVVEYIQNQLGRPISDLKLVLITHMHPDHAGGATVFQKKYKIPLASMHPGYNWYRGLKGRMNHLVDIGLAYWVANRLHKSFENLWYWPNIKFDICLKNRQVLPFFDEWLVLATPGHTDRDFCVFHNPSRVIYVADCILNIKGQFIPPFPIMFPASYKISLEKILQSKPSKVLMAHGGQAQFDKSIIESVLRRMSGKPSIHKVAARIIKSFTNKL